LAVEPAAGEVLPLSLGLRVFPPDEAGPSV